MINCLLVDDEPLARQLLETYIQQTHNLRLVKSCSHAVEAFELLRQYPIDLLFLDIQLPSVTGLAFIRSLREPPPVIFTTAYAHYAVESYEVNAVDYLLKPITFERFNQSIAKFLAVQPVAAPPASHTYFKINGQLVKLIHDDILYAQSIRDYMLLKTVQGPYITHSTMKALADLLPANRFKRIHRSFLVNLSHVTALGRREIRVGDLTIPIGENYRTALTDDFFRPSS